MKSLLSTYCTKINLSPLSKPWYKPVFKRNYANASEFAFPGEIKTFKVIFSLLRAAILS